ncbi:MAG: hypothetical protein NTZ33_06385 [Bacteroidetes bacterium]|nr:hypothetical protein [Bacteroidota bacterium]
MQKSSSFSALVDYFKDIATQHIAIQHTDAKKHFFRFELDEVLSGLNGINYPALILEGYKFDFTDNKSDNIQKKRQGAFILLDHVGDAGDYTKIHEVWDALEEIGDDILAKIKADKMKSGNPVMNFEFSEVNANLIATEMGMHYGIRFLFSIDSKFNAAVNPDKWLSPTV